jgi:lipoprotein-anchoring transpeptidase ErfK/SrfK
MTVPAIDRQRRRLITGLGFSAAALALGGCVSNGPADRQVQALPLAPTPGYDLPPDDDPFADGYPIDGEPDLASIYGPVEGERFPIPAVKLSEIDPAFRRRQVDYVTTEMPGTIVVDPQHHYLYLVQENGRAMRYGVGVGREGFGWSGAATINSKQEWPDWYPPKEMVQRQPELKKVLAHLQGGLGMPGGPRNPLGARALYLWQGNKDTLFRIHGTVEPWTIGKSVSSGCIRMINQDVIDLYQRVPVGTKVVVLSARTV